METGPHSSLEPDVDVTPTPPSPVTGEPPDISRVGTVLRDRVEITSIAITGMFVLAFFYTLYFARAFFVPVVLALMLDFLLSPLVRALKRINIPEPAGALIVLLGALLVLAATAYSLADPVREWLVKAPVTFAKTKDELQQLRRPVEQVTKTAEQVEEATETPKTNQATEVVVKGPSLSDRLFGSTQSLITATIEVAILLYFLLAVGDLFLQKLIKVLPQLKDKKRAVTIARETEASISAYLFVMTLLNIGEGVVVAVAMAALGVPNPVLWGVLAVVLEYIPYVGAVVLTGILAVVGLAAFDGFWYAMAVPGVYIAINFIQSNFLTPMLLGRRLTLNPVAIFIGLVFFWWIWGIPGAFLAVPILATFKIFCDHIETLQPIGEFLGN
ncbi:MAG TPA: AI-2E family transporter [Gemmatimonadales bacterium]|nr:AI-2E family transporter [Gemmatimonadales bacterium]